MAGIETREGIPDRLAIPERYEKKYPSNKYARRWCNETTIRRKGNRGWIPAERDKDDPMRKHDPDTRIKEGDLFLCIMPREVADGEEQRKQAKKDMRMKAVRSQAGAAAASRRYLAQRGSRPTAATGYQGAAVTDDFSIGAHDGGLNDKPVPDRVGALRQAQEKAEEAEANWKAADLPDLDSGDST